MNIFTTFFLVNNPYAQSVEDNWVLFRDTVLKLTICTVVEKYIPHKLLYLHKHLPWLNKNIKL